MRRPDQCTHYWQVQGAPGHRWVLSHAMAHCPHCGSWSIVEYGAGVGPCTHSIGFRSADLLKYGEPPLAKEDPEITEPVTACTNCGGGTPYELTWVNRNDPSQVLCEECYADYQDSVVSSDSDESGVAEASTGVDKDTPAAKAGAV